MLIALALISAAVLTLHGRSLAGDLLLDDWYNVRWLGDAAQPLDLFAGNWSFAERGDPTKNFYRPIPRLSFLADRALWGLDRPGGFHLTNLLLHAANAFLLWGIVRSLWASRRHEFLAVGLFLTHPLTVEAVYWVSARTELWAALFALPAIWITLAFTQCDQGSRFSPHRLWTLPLLALALASKETAVVLPGLLLGLDLWRQRGLSPLRVVWWLGTLGLLAGYFLMRRALFAVFMGGGDHFSAVGFLRMVYEGTALFLNPWSGWASAVGALKAPLVGLLLGLPVLLTLLRRERPEERGFLLAALLWGLASLVPLTSLGFTLESDTRLLYGLTAAFSLLAAGLLSRLLGLVFGDREREMEALIVLGGIWALALGVTSLHVNRDWANASRIARSSINLIAGHITRTQPQDFVLILDPPDKYGRAFIFRRVELQFAVDQVLDERGVPHPLIASLHHLEPESGAIENSATARYRPVGSDGAFREPAAWYQFSEESFTGTEEDVSLHMSGPDPNSVSVSGVSDVPSLWHSSYD